MIKMTVRTLVKIISFIIAVAAVLLAFAVLSWQDGQQAKYVLSSVYRQQISSAASTSQALLSDLQKLEYAQSDYQFTALAAKACNSAEATKAAVEQLPGAQPGLAKTSALLAVTADYCSALSKKISGGEPLSEAELSSLQTLCEKTFGICGALMLAEQTLSVENTEAEGLETLFSQAEASASDTLGLSSFENDAEALPTLIYDGPFSDGVINKKSVFLPEKQTVSREMARQIAAYALDCPINSVVFQSAVMCNGQNCFYFSKGECDVYVTENGGYVKNLSCSADVGDAKIAYDEAVLRGKGFLESIGYKGMAKTYFEESGNILYVNYAYMQGSVTCFTDLIKVGIALDSGKVVFSDATNYLLNHSVSRSFEATVTPDEAQNAVPNGKALGTALIPTDGGGEVFCYEFLKSETGKNDALIYINAQTGREENILILLQSDTGTLVY